NNKARMNPTLTHFSHRLGPGLIQHFANLRQPQYGPEVTLCRANDQLIIVSHEEAATYPFFTETFVRNVDHYQVIVLEYANHSLPTPFSHFLIHRGKCSPKASPDRYTRR